MLAQEAMTKEDLDLSDLIDPSGVVRQLRLSDLPRHSRAPPHIIKKNYELMKSRGNANKINFNT